jgi:membrane protein implicated in regulation of membrane protease activity
MMARSPIFGGTMKVILLLVPCLLALWVPLYNSVSPAIFGIPFFFWLQLVLVPVSALAILAADRVSKN